MMNFDEFKDYVADNIKSYLPSEYEDAEVTINVVRKSSDIELSGINIKRQDSNISPNIYLEHFFEKYEMGDDISDILREISDIRIKHEVSVDFDISKLTDFNEARSMIECRVVNAKTSEQYLSDKPHIVKEGLAIMYAINLGDDHFGGQMSAPITNKIFEGYDISLEELNEIAMANSKEKAIFKSMKEVLCEMMGEAAEYMIPETEPPMYVLTNESKTHGAGLIFCTEVMDAVAQKLGGDVIVLPSSIHEVICLPKSDDVPFKEEELETMIQEVNSTQVSPEEQLADKPFIYDAKSHELIRMDKMNERDADRGISSEKTSVIAKLRHNQDIIAAKEVTNEPVMAGKKKETAII